MNKQSLTCLFALLLCFGAVSGSYATSTGLEAGPEHLARQFFTAFSEQDQDALIPLFASWAVYCKMRQTAPEAWDIGQYNARAWLKEVTGEISHLNDFRVDIEELSVMSYQQDMAAVSVIWKAYVGEKVANEGIDVLSMVQIEGNWLIVQYSALEKFSGP
jgi:hypothetical protein